MFITGAKRTAFGAFGGSLKGKTATELGAVASKGALAQAKIDGSKIDSVIVGNVIQSSNDAAYIARHVGLHAGSPITATALTLNRLCGSGFQAVVSAVHEITCGDAQIVLTGGSESMSQCPYAVRNARWGTKLGSDIIMEDTLWQGLTDQYTGTPMAITAENLAEQHNLSREEVDAFALRSQRTWGQAHEAGIFAHEIVPVELKSRKGPISFDVDEHPRPQSTAATLAKLPSVFKKGGVVTAANASGICDGAAAILVASEEACTKENMTPLSRVVSYQVSGVEPTVMGIGPVPAIKGALARAGLTLNDMSIIEINEAFAAQTLACAKELDLDPERLNVNGGAIALGHPLAASGSRILTHLTNELIRTKQRYAVGAACIGGGQGIAVILENAQL